MDIGSISAQEKDNKQYAENFFMEELEMQGIFSVDTKILDIVAKRKGKVFDATMGPGRHIKYFLKRGFDVCGNDFNRHMIDIARTQIKQKVRYYNKDIRNLSGIKTGSFDYTLCLGASLGSVYRFSERLKAVRELSRVTKKSGLVIIHVHNLIDLSSAFTYPDTLKIFISSILHPKEFELGDIVYEHSDALKQAYMHWFTPEEMKKLMNMSGLKVVGELYLKGFRQDTILPNGAFLKKLRAGGFVFVGKKL